VGFSAFLKCEAAIKKKIHSGKSEASESKELKLKLVWPKHTHEQFFNFTKQFFFIQTRQISVRFDLFNAYAL
jgi:hypothetical protein